MNKRRIITIYIPLIIIVMASVYIWLGGLAEIEWQKEEDVSILMIGKYYEGEYGDEFIRNTFLEVREKLESQEWTGSLALVYYNKPEEMEGRVKNFIGAIVPDSINLPIEDFEYRSLAAPQALRAVLKAHNIVMPNPATVYEKSNATAEEQGIKLDELFIEIYHSNKHVEILFLSRH